jgi:lipid-binding SYLF domain-containing protein
MAAEVSHAPIRTPLRARPPLRTLRHFFHDPESAGFRENVRHARGVLIVPAEARGGFLLGGSSGLGVLFARAGEEEHTWRGPVFYRLSSISIGPQVGGARSEVVLLLMSDRAVDALLSPETKLGGEVAVAAGPIGGGSGTATTDVLSYLRAKGAFIGGAVVGSRIQPHAQLAAGWYGEELTPVDVLVRGRGTAKPAGEQLAQEIDRAASQ